MKQISIFLLFYLWILDSAISQVNVDSSYTYKELIEMLSIARQSSSGVDKSDLAAVYFLLGKYEAENFNKKGQAFEYYTRAKEYYEISGDTTMIRNVDLLIAERYSDAGMYQEAIDIYEEALEYYQIEQNIYKTTHIQNDVGKIYLEKGDAEKGLVYLNQALKGNEILKDTLLLIEFLFNKIQFYEQLNELDSALLVSFDAFKISNRIEDKSNISKCLYRIGYLNKLKSNYQKGIKYLQESEKLASNKPFNEQRRDIYKQLAICHSNIDDYKTAFIYNQKYAELNDSILNLARTQSIDNLTIKYESKEKNIKLKSLEIDKASAEAQNEQQKRALYFLAVGLILLLLLLYYIINFYREKERADDIIRQQKEEINNQKIRELEGNMKISSMQSMLEGQEIERERIAKDLHDSLGGLLSTIKLQFGSVRNKMKPVENLTEYKSANKMLDIAVAEVRTISQNLQPGALAQLGLIPAINDLFNRFDDEHYPTIDFQHYDIPEKMDSMVALSMYRIIQELLYNSIKHANANEILIQINSEDNDLVLQFEDDGIGFDLDKLKRKGMGLENIKSRVTYLKGDISFDTKHGEGTSVLIRLSNIK